MSDTKRYRTRTEFVSRNNGTLTNSWLIGLDIGYSGVKFYSPAGYGCFPSYARKDVPEFVNVPEHTIIYRNNDTGESWLVGACAQNNIQSGDTSDSEAVLYGRERYYDPMFKVVAETGLAMAMIDHNRDENGLMLKSFSKVISCDTIAVRTGLPAKYMNDKQYLTNVISGSHNFSIKIEDGEWLDFCFEITENNINVIEQPKGTLFSVCMLSNGSWHPNARAYLGGSGIIFDVGFNTLDIYSLNNGTVGDGATYTDLGMKRILEETCGMISEKYNVNVTVPTMQKNLETGKITYFDIENLTSTEYDFSDLLLDATNRVCEEAIRRLANSVKLSDYRYLTITGGTGEAWCSNIEKRLKGMETLHILHGNDNDKSPLIYSNVRGYYLFGYKTLLKEEKAA